MNPISPEQAVQLLRDDQVVALPTETVYGLAARISSPLALKRIFTTKERPLFDPLIVHVQDIHQARQYAAEWPAPLDLLAKTFWPGPLTLVVPKNSKVDPLITAGLDTVGLRAPAHPLAQQILVHLKEPFAAPSANRFGRTSPSRSEHVRHEFNDQVPVVDGGPCKVGVESTVVRLTTPTRLEVLRPGSVSEQHLAATLKKDFPQIQITRAVSQASPGHLEQHYQPRLPLVIVHGPDDEKSRLTLKQQYQLASSDLIYKLNLSAEAPVAARELYHQLHLLSQNPQGLIVYWAGHEWQAPEWAAVVDRLTRAAQFQFQK
ncbi:MAG: L-threonylcarbamoyladenylate synthase [Bdellovibrionales bacterium]